MDSLPRDAGDTARSTKRALPPKDALFDKACIGVYMILIYADD